MKPTELLKVAAIAVMTSGLIVGCQQSSTGDEMAADTEVADECMGATPEVRNAIYAAKLKNARARNLGAEWEENAKIIAEAEQAAADCENVRAKILAEKAEASAAEAIAMLKAEEIVEEEAEEAQVMNDSPYLGGYLVVSGDNLWSIAAQETIYGNPFQWPLIYKANSGQIKDADLIYAGQYFYIPKARGAERAAAIEHAKNRGAWTIGETEASDIDYLSQ
ncbi:MAG: LysM peptidoglycan-binding domain-containing protein [Gammaproteobacteria bacterium]|nr:LysM peptidoglycan-binding domain-containing protein [Gammaproteobacteria bacterium]